MMASNYVFSMHSLRCRISDADPADSRFLAARGDRSRIWYRNFIYQQATRAWRGRISREIGDRLYNEGKVRSRGARGGEDTETEGSGPSLRA